MEENKFTKEQLKNSKKFMAYKDILSAFLDNEKCYTLEEAQNIVDNFLNKEAE